MSAARSLARFREKAALEWKRLGWKIHLRLRRELDLDTRQGRFTVRVGPEEGIGRRLYLYGHFELDLIESALATLREAGHCPPRGEGTLLDVGANNGVISIGALHTGQMRQAIAIEPEPGNFDLLVRNVAANRLEDRIITIHRAVSDAPGQLEFELSRTNSGDHRVRRRAPDRQTWDRNQERDRQTISVSAGTLDDLLDGLPRSVVDDIALLWIDIQGYEGFALRGADRLLARGLPAVAEIWPYGMNRTGMTPAEFSDVTRRHWRFFWVRRHGRFVRYPLDLIETFFVELGPDGRGDNVLLTR